MREIDWDKILIYIGAILVTAAAVPLLHRCPRSRGKNILFHVAYIVSFGLVLFFVPDYIQNEIFSPGGVLVIGTLLPVYESIVTVCTLDEKDDVRWLQYWIASGTFSYCTEFMDNIREVLPQAGEHWYEFEFFFTLWLMLPFTDGSALIYDFITKPYFAPTAVKIKASTEGWIQFLMLAVNSSYLWFLWFAFVSLSEEQRRFIVVASGTVYPMAASTVALTTEGEDLDSTYWLTYWSCFSLLFVIMDYLENFVGSIRGFYSICLAATVYLFLPMFGGAEAVFRRVLVPLSGQYENMLLHDAYLVRKGMEKTIPESMHQRVMTKASDIFKPKAS